MIDSLFGMLEWGLVKWFLTFLALIWGSGMFGCANMFDAHVKEFDLMRGMAADAATRLQDGSIGQMQVSGQALNPGIKVHAAVVYEAEAQYDGLAGQFGASAQGQYGRAVDVKDVLEIMNTSTDLSKARAALIEKLIDKAAGAATTQPVKP